jgi:hypothetical protein
VDDVAILTSSVRDLELQLRKLELWSRHARIKVNAAKCAITGILHGSHSKHMNPSDDAQLRRRLEGKLRVSGQPIPYLPPDEPYRYLGFHVTLTLNWSAQYRATKTHLVNLGQQLCSSMATPTQALQVIESKIRPAVTYPLSLAPFTLLEMEHLDTALAQIARKCCHLPRSFPRYAAHASKSHGGLGVHSLVEDYVQITASSLAEAINDPGTLGLTTSALLTMQQQRLAGLPVDQLNLAAHQSTAVRQLHLLRRAGIAMKGGKLNQHNDCEGQGLWELMQQCLGPHTLRERPASVCTETAQNMY